MLPFGFSTASRKDAWLWAASVSTASIWGGVTLAYAIPAAPATFLIMACAAAIYAGAALLSTRRQRPVPTS